MPSSFASTAPGARRLSSVVTAARRSVSLTRSSAAPEITVSPSAKRAATARIGISSMRRGMISPPNDAPRRDADRTRMSASASRSLQIMIFAPMSDNTSRIPVRVGLTPTSCRRMSLPSIRDAATSQYAAELMSPGTQISSGANSSSAGSIVTFVPSRSILAPKALSIRSVWSRESAGSVRQVALSA